MKCCIVCASCLILLSASNFSPIQQSATGQPAKKLPPLTLAKLKQFASRAVSDGSAKPAQTIINTKERTYTLGHFPLEDDDALDFAAALQLQIEVLRKRVTKEKDKKLWNPFFGKLEDIVAQGLRLAEKENNHKVRDMVSKLRVDAWELLGAGFDKLGKFKEIAKVPTYELSISITPRAAAKADVYFVRWGKYQYLKDTGHLSELDTYWRRPPTQVYEGEYFFAARWRGKTVLPKQSISIDRKNQKVSLSFE